MKGHAEGDGRAPASRLPEGKRHAPWEGGRWNSSSAGLYVAETGRMARRGPRSAAGVHRARWAARPGIGLKPHLLQGVLEAAAKDARSCGGALRFVVHARPLGARWHDIAPPDAGRVAGPAVDSGASRDVIFTVADLDGRCTHPRGCTDLYIHALVEALDRCQPFDTLRRLPNGQPDAGSATLRPKLLL